MEPGRYLKLELTDIPSNLIIAVLELDAAAVLELLSSTQVGSVDGVPAWLIPERMRRNLGKINVHVSRQFPSYPPDESKLTVAQWAAELEAFAEFARKALGGAVIQVSPKNHGSTNIVIRSYQEPDDADYWVAHSQQFLDKLTGPPAWKSEPIAE
jgi:hypothetical protein